MTLQQHLTDTCGTAEVAVNLERRVGIEQVGIGAATRSPLNGVGNQGEHVLDNLQGMVAVEHTSPEIGLPAKTPARRHVATLLQRGGSGSKQFRMRIGRNLVRGVESV